MEKIEGRGTILYFTFNLGKEFFRDTFFFYSLSMWKYHGKDEEIIGEWEVDETNFNIEDLEKKIKTAVKLRELSELMAEELWNIIKRELNPGINIIIGVLTVEYGFLRK